MRIGFDATILGPHTRQSGIGKYAMRLLNQIREIDGSNEYIAYGPADCVRPDDLHPLWQWKPAPAPRMGKLSAIVASMRSMPHAAAEDGLDLFHTPTVHPRLSWPAVPRGMPCPLVVTVHDLIPLSFYGRPPFLMPLRWRLYYRWNLRAAKRADAVITVSEASRQDILNRLALSPDRLRVIYNGVDVPPEGSLTDFHETRISTSYALFVGSFEPRKNLLRLIRAYARAVADGLPYDLVVVASPRSGPTEAVRLEIDRAGIAERVRFLDGVSDDMLWSLYREAELFVFPSLAEGFGLPPLEAMAAGSPVIASDLPALRETLGEAAIFLNPESEDQLAAAMVSLAGNLERRRELALLGSLHARRYSWRDCAERTLRVYHEVSHGGAFARNGAARVGVP